MQSITTEIRPSGSGKIYLSPLGLSKAKNFDISLRREMTKAKNRIKREYSTPQPEGPCCDLADRKKYVPNELTGYARTAVIEGCAVLENQYPKECLAFFTGTVPTRDPAWYEIFMKYWPTAHANFVRKLKYHLRKNGAQDLWVARTEYHKDGWPHLHLVYLAKKHRKGKWILTIKQIRKLWRDSWESNEQILLEFDWRASTRVEAIKKSVKRYMAKYLSKAIDNVELCSPVSITRCWGSSHRIKQLIRNGTFRLVFEGWDMTYHGIRQSLRFAAGRVGCSKSIYTESGGLWTGLTASRDSIMEVIEILEAWSHPPSGMDGLMYMSGVGWA